MESPGMLYAWANPVAQIPWLLDHTWVTSYPAPFGCEVQPPQHFWYCWGDCHPAGTGTSSRALGHAAGSLELAKCICAPDDTSRVAGSPALGGINEYLIDGVCHQVANRVLYATVSAGGVPLTVEKARGYVTSVLLFGEYGVNQEEWRQRRQRCKGNGTRVGGQGTVGRGTAFRNIVRAKLKGGLSRTNESRIVAVEARLHEQHRTIARRARAGQLSGRRFAEEVNALVMVARRTIGVILGNEDFVRAFGDSPDQMVGVADPGIAEGLSYERPRPRTGAAFAVSMPGGAFASGAGFLLENMALGSAVRKSGTSKPIRRVKTQGLVKKSMKVAEKKLAISVGKVNRIRKAMKRRETRSVKGVLKAGGLKSTSGTFKKGILRTGGLKVGPAGRSTRGRGPRLGKS